MLAKAKAIEKQIVDWRRDFHMHPELGFRESRTSAKVAEVCEQLGYRVRRGVGRTGVVADFGNGKPVVAIRADMDALPILESNTVPYVSQNPGVMHACGHDSHTAMALGAASLLAQEKFPGTVRFLFQPSEEVGDEEGISGAPRMIADGAMEGVDFVIAQHVDAVSATGTIGIESGATSGGVDSWFGKVIGQGGHGAKPEATIDPFVITAHVIFALNGIVSRRINPFDPAVVSIGSVNGGFTQNVIPDQVDLTGTLRYADFNVQKQIHAEIARAFEISKTLGGNYELKFEIGDPPLVNDPRVSDLIHAVGVDLLGMENIQPVVKTLGAEDFGRFLEHAPGAMFTLGVRIDSDPRQIHNQRFDINEEALPIGTAVLAESALRFLRSRS
jgi:amidohydrolase